MRIGLGNTINIQATVDAVHGNAAGCTDPFTGDTYAFDQNGNSCAGTGSGNASGTNTPLTSGSMTDQQMQDAATLMCKNAGQTWDVASQSCKTTLIAGVSNNVVYGFAAALAVMVLMSMGGRRR